MHLPWRPELTYIEWVSALCYDTCASARSPGSPGSPGSKWARAQFERESHPLPIHSHTPGYPKCALGRDASRGRALGRYIHPISRGLTSNKETEWVLRPGGSTVIMAIKDRLGTHRHSRFSNTSISVKARTRPFLLISSALYKAPSMATQNTLLNPGLEGPVDDAIKLVRWVMASDEGMEALKKVFIDVVCGPSASAGVSEIEESHHISFNNDIIGPFIQRLRGNFPRVIYENPGWDRFGELKRQKGNGSPLDFDSYSMWINWLVRRSG